MKTPILLILFAALSACDPPTHLQPVNVVATESSDRFSVTFVSQFYDANAYNHYRSIYVIKDRVNGTEYVGVTGVGISEVATHEDTRTSVDGNGNTIVETETVKHEQ